MSGAKASKNPSKYAIEPGIGTGNSPMTRKNLTSPKEREIHKTAKAKDDNKHGRGDTIPNHADPRVAENVATAVMLRKAGTAYKKIAEHIGVSETMAYEYVQIEMRRLNKFIHEEISEYRRLQMARLEEMLMSYWARRADPKFGVMILATMNKMDALSGIATEKIDVNLTQSTIEKMQESDLDKFIATNMVGVMKPIPVINRKD